MMFLLVLTVLGRSSSFGRKSSVAVIVVALVLGFNGQSELRSQDGDYRVHNPSAELARPVASRIPERDESTGEAAQTALQADVMNFEKDFAEGFSVRPRIARLPSRKPAPQFRRGKTTIQQTAWEQPARTVEHGSPRRDEYIYDGNDRGHRVKVDRSWNIYGLDSEDTIGHFDTLDGRRLVTPSNRVAIYAPRFGAVRRVDGVYNARLSQQVTEFEEQTPLVTTEASDFSTSTQQHVGVERYEGSERASAFLDRTRGVLADNTTELFGFKNSFSPYEHLSLIRFGRFESSESARLGLGMQSAEVWQDDTQLRIMADNAQPVIVNDVAKVQQLVHIESDDNNAILRVVKVASKIAARAGEKVEFTIRFDNLSGKRVGNVTLIDDLTTRLEYIVDSSECSLPAKLVTSRNDVGSTTLRWEIRDPLPGGKGGVIRFDCRVR